jgi:hypothetical protein
MTNDDDTSDKPTDPQAPAAARTRKIVRRSASTREQPGFTPGEENAGAPAAEGAQATEGAAPAAAAPAEGAAPAARPRATFDARAPRRTPAPGEGRSNRGGGDYRAPQARPMGARPLPGGPRAPAPEGPTDGPHGWGTPGDYRGPAARPMGSRPLPGGPRGPARDFGDRPRGPRPEGAGPRPEGDRPRGPRPEGDRPRGPRPEGAGPRRDDRPRGPRPDGAPFAGAGPAAAPPARPAPKPVAPPAPAKAAALPPKLTPIPVFVPKRPTGGAGKPKPALTAKEALIARTKATAAPAKAKPAAKPEGEAAATFDPALVSVEPAGAKAALVSAGEGAVLLVDAWLAASNVASIVEVVESDDVASPARKAARRALNILRARGVAIPERRHVVKMDDRAEVSCEATMIPPDGSGTFSLSITSRDASGRYHIAEVIIREPLGIVQAGSGWLSGSQIKEGRTRAMEGLGVAPVTVPVEWARQRIAEARKLNATSRQVLPLGLEACRELIEASATPAAHPLAELEAAVTAEQATAAAAGSSALHQEPEMRAWLPDRAALDEMLQKVGERLGAENAGDSDKVNEALREEIDAATDRFFSPEVREIIARRLTDAAISIRSRKGTERAVEVLSVARAIREAGLITAPPREIPFLTGFFQKALGILAQQGGGQLRVPVTPGSAPAPAEEPST